MRKIYVNGNVLGIWRCLMMWGRGCINTVCLYPGYTLGAIETMKGKWKHHCFGLKYISHRWRCHCHYRWRHPSHIAPSLFEKLLDVITKHSVTEITQYVFNPLEIILVRDSRIESVFFNSFIQTFLQFSRWAAMYPGNNICICGPVYLLNTNTNDVP